MLTWITPGGGYTPTECPQLTKEPTADDYFALLPKAAATQGKVELERKGGLPALGQGIAFRGPDRLDGSQILPNYTFRLADNPEFTQFFTHMQGRIENGVVVTEPLEEMTFQDGGQTGFKLYDARMRIEFLPDNKMKAVMGGYYDWRRRMTNWGRARLLEPNMRFQCPGIYNAFKRAADGLKDPVTGDFNGISVAYDMVGVRAFIPPKQLEALSVKNAR